jgi:hypothetical protein
MGSVSSGAPPIIQNQQADDAENSYHSNDNSLHGYLSGEISTEA